MNTTLAKNIAVAAASLLWSYISPALPVAAVLTLLVFTDMLTAWQLGRRVAARNPAAAHSARLHSRGLGRMVRALAYIYGAMLLAVLVDAVIPFVPFRVYPLTVGAILMQQILSILENISSSNSAPWAAFLRRFLADKTQRHIG